MEATMTLRNTIFVFLVSSVVACSVDSSIQPQCKGDGDCQIGSTCNLNLTPHLCVSSCQVLCNANETCVNGACVATTCIPACNSNQTCNTSVNPPACMDLADGTVTLTQPALGAVVGGAQVTVKATAGAPGGPTQVAFRIEQGGQKKAEVIATSGNQGVYTAVMPLVGSGLVSGAANVFAKVSWNQNGTLKTKDSAPVAVTADEDAPSITGPGTDHPFYSSTAAGAPPNASVTVQIVDVGVAGVDPSTARLALIITAHSYPAALAPGGGAGVYQFAVPVADLGVGANKQGPVNYLVTATDKVGNAGSFDGGVINVDNEPPTFTNPVVPAAVFGGDAGIAVSIDVSDPAGGSGLDPTTIGLLVVGATAPIAPTGTSGGTASFAIHGSDLQSPTMQGPVSFNFVAKDNVLNQGTSAQQSIKVDYAAPTIGAVTVTNNPAAGDNGYYPIGTSISVPVSVSVDDGAMGSGVAGATLTVIGKPPVMPTGSSTLGTVKTFSFLVPTTVQTPGSEAKLAISVNATDVAGNSVTQTAPAMLKIDDAGPQVQSVAVDASTAPDAVVGAQSVPWFNQMVATDIDIKATVTDQGSGVNLAPLQLVLQGNVSTRVDRPGMVTRDPGTDNYHFKVLRSGGPIGAGSQGLVAYQVLAVDNLGHAQQADLAGTRSSVNTLGIDGMAPVLTFTPKYPAVNTGCDSGVVCGHDGSHFWRLGDDGSTLSFSSDDTGGSGPNLSSAATCAFVGGTTCTVAYSGTDYTFTMNPSQVALTSTDNATNTGFQGDGTVAVTVTAKDAVGNQGSAGPTKVKVTRIRWVKKFAGLINLRGSPIVTPPIGTGAAAKSLILVAGTNPSADPIFALDKTGAVVGHIGNAQGVTTVANNMAYSPTTNTLYVTQDNSKIFNSFHLSTSGFTSGSPCNLGANALTNGPPALFGTSPTEEVAFVSDAGQHKLFALSAVGDCSTAFVQLVGTSGLGPPSSDENQVYLSYQNTGVARLSYNSTSGFSGLTNTDLTLTIVGQIALATNLFFGENRNYHSYQSDVSTNLWTAMNAGRMADVVTSTPVIARGLVVGMSQSGMRAFNQSGSAATAGTQSWDTGNLNTVSAPAIAAGGAVMYFSDTSNSELLAAPFSLTTFGPATWKFAGDAVNLGFSGPGSEPTLAGPHTPEHQGVLFFGAGNGNFYALMTDSTGPFVPTSGTDWPRVGFDNCNSGNSSYANCQ